MEVGLRSSEAFLVRRCQIVLASEDGAGVPRLARQVGGREPTVRTVGHAFHPQGVAGLPRGSARPPTPPRARGERGRPATPGRVASESPARRPPPQSVARRVSGRGELCPRPHPPAGQPRSDPPGRAPRGRERAASAALDSQSRAGLGPEKKARDRLRRLAASPPEWALGFAEEPWGSRVAQPARPAWPPAPPPLPLGEQPGPRRAPAPKARAGYGLRGQARPGQGVSPAHVGLRVVADRPGSAVTLACLPWGCAQWTARGKTALVVGWENASGHGSPAVRQGLRAPNRQGKGEGQGVRLVRCPLPSKSPWLTPLDAHWVHGKRAVVEPARLLTAAELVERVNTHFGCPYEEPLSIPQEVS